MPVLRSRLTVLSLTLALTAVLYASRTPHWGGWMLMYASFVATAGDPYLRRNGWNLAVVWLALVVHHALSVYNGFVSRLPGAEMDAKAFHGYASEHIQQGHPLQWSMGAEFYENLLGYLYAFGGDSVLLGQSLSVLAFALACLVFVRFLELLAADRYAPWLLAVFGLLPSAVVFESVTLREPFQLLLFMTGAYAGSRVLVRPAWWAAPACLISFLGMGFFHQLLLVYAVFAAGLLLAMAWSSGRLSRLQKIAVAGAVGVALVAGTAFVRTIETAPGDDYIAMMSSGPVRTLVEYREDIDRLEPRTAFAAELDATSPAAFVGSAALVYLHYTAAPFPWAVENLLDLYASMESLLRLVLLAAAAAALWHNIGSKRRLLLFPILLYLSMTLLWALGTTNHGQALRHHLLTNWILFACGGPWLFAALHGLLERSRAGLHSRPGCGP